MAVKEHAGSTQQGGTVIGAGQLLSECPKRMRISVRNIWFTLGRYGGTSSPTYIIYTAMLLFDTITMHIITLQSLYHY